MSLTAAAGHFFVFQTIKTHGALLFSTMVILRSMLAILLSSIIYSNQLSVGEYVATVLIVFTVAYQIYSSCNREFIALSATQAPDEEFLTGVPAQGKLASKAWATSQV